ncbi:universal stress protein [Natronorubrum texcoconense]|uniref:Nucleotide-binding universal stress protein, UspA family n=1 Tax=Natronorubrum texcoconense TaxID=1095776 RepID=A0A1G8XJZ8_9EURY|nr:universal stress protein [Natronorubrum texcoconense]SDJ90972.1 Nucleotide-binding universal stress protein, UspA family [Natronorubrum texcoconense]
MLDETSDTDGTLLVPIANAETVDRQLETAIDIATDRSYRIFLVYVLEVPPQLSLQDGRRYLLEDDVEKLLAEATARIESRGVPAESRIRLARGVARGIVGAVEKYDVDAVLMGWRGRPPRRDVILGSHVDKVLRNADCDVLVQRIKTPRPDDVDSVLVPVAGGPHSGFAAETAASIARRHDASVTLLHLRESDDPDRSREDAQALLAEAAAEFDDLEVERALVESETVAGTITDWTTRHDVTVLGVSRGGLLQRALLGTVSEAVGRHAAGTVILVKRYDPVPSRLRRLLP